MKEFVLSALLAIALSSCATYSPENKAAMDAKIDAVQSDTIDVISLHSFSDTDRKLKAAIESRGLKIFKIINHGEGARTVGMDIGKSKLYLFGNPKSGSPLMMENPEMGLELPMKVLVYQAKDGTVHVVRADIGELTEDYGVTGRDELIGKISGALSAIVAEATG